MLDPARRAEVESLHRRALNWEPVDRLPVVMTLPLARLKVSRDDLATARIMERCPTGVSLLYEAASVPDAQETMKA